MGVIAGGVVIQEGVPRPVNPFGRIREVRSGESIQSAVDAAAAGDVIYIAPGEYDEAVTITKSNITLVGIGGRGSVAIAPSAADASALTIDGSAARRTDITLVNLGLEGDGTGSGLHVKADVRRVRAYSCKIEGGASALLIESTGDGAPSDNLFQDCELCWSTNAARIAVSGGGDPVTQTRIQGCHLHNYTGRGVFVDTVHSADLWLVENTFARDEAGDEPSDEYVLAAVASTTGVLQGNHFPAAEATGKISLAAGVIRSGNWFTDGGDA